VVENLARVPVVAACLGPVAGLGAARVAASHSSAMVEGTSQLFVAGPPLVEHARSTTRAQCSACYSTRAACSPSSATAVRSRRSRSAGRDLCDGQSGGGVGPLPCGRPSSGAGSRPIAFAQIRVAVITARSTSTGISPSTNDA
jgi:hypothetical protein